jgi:TP901 family phage tail tape measure protein
MADRTIKAIITASASGLITELDKASRKSKEFGDNLSGSISKNEQSINTLSNTAGAMGLAIGAGVAATAKAAIDWESAWAGVTKTVNGSAAELATLQDELREMARTLPASHTEIAAVAEAAGQLGVETENVSAFTKTMINLGETTNLSAEEAATSLAQLMNVMGTAPEHVERLGSTIVDLGNNSATTERDIVQMAQRIAGAGRQVGLSEGEVLAFSTALASVGIDAEAGGTAISQSMLKIDGAVRQGGDSLQTLAEVSGVSTEEFKRSWEEDAAGALNSFVVGLGGVQESGGDVNAVLSELGITGIRESDALRRLASSGDILGDSLDRQSEAWAENTALTEEAEKRYATTEAQIQVAWNNIKDAAIEAGAVLLPVISDIAAQAADLAKWFGDLGEPTKTALLIGATALAGLLLAGAGIGKLVIGVNNTIIAFKTLGITAGGLRTKLAALNGGALLAVAGFVAAQAASAGMNEQLEKNGGSVEQVTSDLLDLANGGDNLDDRLGKWGGSFANLGQGVNDTASFFKSFTEAQGAMAEGFTVVGNALGMTSTLQGYRNELDKLDKSLVAMKPEDSAAAFRKLTDEMSAAGIPLKDQLVIFDDYKAKLVAQANELKITGLTAQDYADWMGGKIPPAVKKAQDAADKAAGATDTLAGSQDKATTSAEKQKKALEDLEEALRDGIDLALQLSGSQIGVEAALDDARAAAKENGETLDIHTKKGRANKTALDDIARASLSHRDALIKEGATTAEVTRATNDAREAFIKIGTRMGLTKKEAKKLADEYFGVNEETDDAAAKTDKARKEFRDQAIQMGLTKTQAKELADKMFGVGKESKTTEGKSKNAKDEIRRVATQMGLTKKEAQKLIDKYGEVPTEVKTTVSVPGHKRSVAEIKELRDWVDNLKDKVVRIDYRSGNVTSDGKISVPGGGRYADGGLITGPGTGTSDSIPILASNREFMIKEKSASSIGLDHLNYMNEHGELPKFRDGGLITKQLDFDTKFSASIGRDLKDSVGAAQAAALKAATKAFQSAPAIGNITRPVPGGFGTFPSYPGHTGVDFPVGAGTPIQAVMAGVVKAVRHLNYSYGNHVILGHANGMETLYAHMSRTAASQGRQVSGGDVIGYVGSTGNSTGNHLHFTYQRPGGGYVNPTSLLNGNLADGGMVQGWSPHRKADNIPIYATAGEFMQPVDSVQHYGTEFMEAVRKKQFPQMSQMADGGAVRREVIAHRFAPNLVLAGAGAGSFASSQERPAPVVNITLPATADPASAAAAAGARITSALSSMGY